jgi:putative spermidine/putrescine transport system ATP-binding protein
MVINPDLLLLDEPLSNLDAKLRVQMRVEIKRLLADTRITTIYVTHDQEESLVLSDRIVIMNQGQIEQIGSPQEIYTRPNTPFVADFMGFENIFEGQVLQVQEQEGKQLCTVRVGESHVMIEHSGHLFLQTNDQLWIAIRPDSLSLVSSEFQGQNIFSGSVLLHTYRGNSAEYLIDTELGRLTVLESEQQDYQPGDTVRVLGKPQDLTLITPGA